MEALSLCSTNSFGLGTLPIIYSPVDTFGHIFGVVLATALCSCYSRMTQLQLQYDISLTTTMIIQSKHDVTAIKMQIKSEAVENVVQKRNLLNYEKDNAL